MTKLATRRRSLSEAPRLIGYVRVSTEEQAETGVSLAAQRARLAAFAEAHGFTLLEIATDAGMSGKTTPSKRPALAAALARVKAGEADGIVALKLDRLSRSTRDVLDLIDRAERGGWRLLSVSESLDTGTAAGRMVVTVLAALAQMEREQIGERTSAAMDQVAREGRARSRFVPFGFRVNGRPDAVTVSAGERGALVAHSVEQALLARIVELEATGLGAHRIARELNEAGTTNPRTRGKWSTGTVAALLRTVARRAALSA